MRHPKHRSRPQFFLHRFDHRGMAMPRHQSPKTQIEIDIFVPVDIMQMPALSIAHKKRIRIVSPVIASDTKRQSFGSLSMSLSRSRRPLLVSLNFLLQSLVHKCLPKIFFALNAQMTSLDDFSLAGRSFSSDIFLSQQSWASAPEDTPSAFSS